MLTARVPDPAGLGRIIRDGAGRVRAIVEERDAAEEYAVSEAKAGALAEALRRGATGEIAVTHELLTQDGSTNSGTIYLGSKAVAHAVGAMSL